MNDYTGATGGGSATNAGVNFQQRVAAFILAACLGTVDIASIFGFANTMIPNLVRFESSSPIDDVTCETTIGVTHFFQVKRTINLSDTEDSEFASVINQFVRQFVPAPREVSAYWLVVGSGASRRVSSTLKSLLDGIRLNSKAGLQNPMSKDDEGVLRIFKSQFQRCFRSVTNREPNNNEFESFAQKAHIIELNVEDTQPHEVVALMYLQKISIIPAELFWKVLIVQALNFAKERWSVTFAGLHDYNARFLAGSKSTDTPEEATDEAFRLTETMQGRLPTGKEVLLVRDWPLAEKLFIVELFRFNDACLKKQSFGAFGVRLQSNIEPVNVLHRCATWDGLVRYVESIKETLKDEELILMPANGTEDIEESTCAQAHREVLNKLVQNKKSLLKCLHCGRPISEEWVDYVELDDEETTPDLGPVHQECRRPIDRVVGRKQLPWFKDRLYLKGFDTEKWLSSIQKGQRVFQQLNSTSGSDNRRRLLAWGGKSTRHSRGKFCVGHVLTDGTARYITTRGKLNRFTEAEARELVNQMNASIEEARVKNRPLGYSSETWIFGTYADIVPMMTGDELFVECVHAKLEPFSEHIARRFNIEGQYYAPVMILRDRDSDAILNIDNAVLVGTDPLSMGRLMDNWSRLLGNLGNLELDIVGTDEEFDELMAEIESDEMFMLINPLFGTQGDLISGIQLIPQSLNGA